ncbi:hypothetical protein INT45_011695, partial [Circinella minor]
MAPLKVIGAAYSRNGTNSLRVALNMLGYNTHHMINMIDGGGKPELFEEAWDHPEKDIDWDYIYEGWDAAVDSPTVCFVKPLMEKYPDAKVILIERDVEKWYKSVKNTILEYNTVDMSPYTEYGQAVHRLTRKIWLDGAFLNNEYTNEPEKVKAKYKAHNAWVKEYVPKDRLLVLNLDEGIGWEKICEFLDKPVPPEPYPRSNSTSEMSANMPGFLKINLK